MSRFILAMLKSAAVLSTSFFIPLSPHDALKQHFTSLKRKLFFLQPRVLERKFA